MDINQIAQHIKSEKLPPVDSWNPDFCGDMDMVIKRDGSWFYMGTPIGRPQLVKLFSTVLRKEGNDYFLVTPVEKIGIRVEDAPFLAVLMGVHQNNGEQVLVFTDNVGNQIIAGSEHPIRVEINQQTGEPSPYILVRKNLEALINRNVFYQLVDLAEEKVMDNKKQWVVSSAGKEFVLGCFE